MAAGLDSTSATESTDTEDEDFSKEVFNVLGLTNDDSSSWRSNTSATSTSSHCQESYKPRLVIAIDFGTYATGYAMQWRSDFEKDRLNIWCAKWMTDGGFCTYKAPTSLLLKPDKSFAAFGYEAQTKYSMLGMEDENQKKENWYFFRNFKMMLYHRENITDQSPVEDASGKHLAVVEILSIIIKHLKDRAINHLHMSGVAYPEKETKWVLTVPAIWNDRAKLIMRNAAEKAGVLGTNLTLGLEPECASIYCLQLPPDQLEIARDNKRIKSVIAPNSTIMVVDMGGGTVDITTIRVNEDYTMQHESMTEGGALGGMQVDANFQMLLQQLIGVRILQEFKQKDPNAYNELVMEFETKKRQIKLPSDPDNERFRIKLPHPLKELWEKRTKRKIEKILKKNDKFKDVMFVCGHLSFDPNRIRRLFDDIIGEIFKCIKGVIGSLEQQMIKLDTVILVGGFAESDYVVQTLRRGLRDSGVPVVRPQSPESAVLNGAVLFGHHEDIVTSRIMRYTYGVCVTQDFNDAKHKKEEMFKADNGKILANNVFSKHVQKGQTVRLGNWISDETYFALSEHQKTANIMIYSSTEKNPIHTSEESCKWIGTLQVELPQSGLRGNAGDTKRAMEVAMSFGGTELKVKAVGKPHGKTFRTSLKL